MVYVSLDQHLPVYSYHLALVEQSDGQRRTFLYRVVSLVDLYAISEPLVRRSVGTVLLERIPYAVGIFSGYLGYLVLAHYIHVHLTWNRSKRFIIGIVSMLIGAAITIYSFYVQAVPGEILPTPVLEIGWAFCTINCVLLTAGTFLMFSCIELPETPRFVLELSKLSYGMYLMHIFWLGLWVAVFKSVLPLPTVAAIPAIATCTFICCFVTTKVISLIPGGKWIVG